MKEAIPATTPTRGALLGALAAVILGGIGASAGCGLARSGTSVPVLETPCDSPAQCKTDDPCKIGNCGDDKLCAFAPRPDGEPPIQAAGDCARITCTAGEATSSADPLDVDDGNPCTTDECVPGPMHTLLDGVLCPLGTSTGTCVAGECIVTCGPDDPPEKCDDALPCTGDSCNVGKSQCEHVPLDGTPLADTSTTDCLDLYCVGGLATPVPDDSELPDDGNDCTSDACVNGAPQQAPLPEGSSCQAGTCNASGACVGCNTPYDCSGSDDECKSRTCEAAVCGFAFTPFGTQTSSGQQLDDCVKQVCDGAGSTLTIDDDSEVPPDALECTQDSCQGGFASHSNIGASQPCPATAGKVCNGNGVCVDCVGDGDCPADHDCAVGLGICCDDPAFLCPGRCGVLTDDCGNAVDCGGCLSAFEACVANTCGCTPDPTDSTCAGKCGLVLDNCNLTVSCPGCSWPALCDGVTSTCVCATCASQGITCGAAEDGCGGTLACDGVKNGAETAIDCGGPGCPPCGQGAACSIASDCQSGNCVNMVCAGP